MPKQLPTKGGFDRAVKTIFKGAKTTKAKSAALKKFAGSKVAQAKAFKTAGLTGSAKLGSIIKGGIVGGAALAGATAIKKAKKGFDKDLTAAEKSRDIQFKLDLKKAKQLRKKKGLDVAKDFGKAGKKGKKRIQRAITKNLTK